MLDNIIRSKLYRPGSVVRKQKDQKFTFTKKRDENEVHIFIMLFFHRLMFQDLEG